MELSTEQQGAVDAVLAWMAEGSPGQVFRLFGYAGSGKTTIAQDIAEQVPGEIHFAAFT